VPQRGFGSFRPSRVDHSSDVVPDDASATIVRLAWDPERSSEQEVWRAIDVADEVALERVASSWVAALTNSRLN